MPNSYYNWEELEYESIWEINWQLSKFTSDQVYHRHSGVWWKDKIYNKVKMYGDGQPQSINSYKQFIKEEHVYITICVVHYGDDTWENVIRERLNRLYRFKVIIWGRELNVSSVAKLAVTPWCSFMWQEFLTNQSRWYEPHISILFMYILRRNLQHQNQHLKCCL